MLEAYRFYKGKGIFNKVRYKKQHEAVSSYIDAHYPDAFYSDITETGTGWSCIVHSKNTKIMLYMSKASDGRYVFWEKTI